MAIVIEDRGSPVVAEASAARAALAVAIVAPRAEVRVMAHAAEAVAPAGSAAVRAAVRAAIEELPAGSAAVRAATVAVDSAEVAGPAGPAGSAAVRVVVRVAIEELVADSAAGSAAVRVVVRVAIEELAAGSSDAVPRRTAMASVADSRRAARLREPRASAKASRREARHRGPARVASDLAPRVMRVRRVGILAVRCSVRAARTFTRHGDQVPVQEAVSAVRVRASRVFAPSWSARCAN
jgi:hypothetical protein